MPHMVELSLRGSDPAQLSADLRVTSAAATLAVDVPVKLDLTALLARTGDPAAYGKELSRQLFAEQRLREAWLKARARAAGDAILQLRLHIPASAEDLHALHWETLCDPETALPLALDERVRLVRTLDTADLTPFRLAPRPELRALVVVSNPRNPDTYQLAKLNVDDEVARIRTAPDDIPCTILGCHKDAVGRATLANITAHVRTTPPLVFVVAHGTQQDDGPVLWLEQDDGTSDQIAGATFVQAVERLTTRPLCMALLSCQSAGSGYDDTLSALGPQLVQIGIPAVLAFQGNVAMETVKALLPTLISELARDGQFDRALAAARAALGEKEPWWQAVAWLRTDGRVWDSTTPDPRIATRETTLCALLHDHSGFIASRMEAFVGREAELAEIRQRIAERLSTGGYVTITGQAGQGKSSVIAKLVADALGDFTTLRERLLTPGTGIPICHFIPFSPGPDHQVGLLRNLIARLCLTYDLPDFYTASDSRPALRDYFATALRDLAKQGCQQVIYLDGLDQIEEDASGGRDLSFLPEEPPEGIVFVLGTRPNDTLKPLELRKPQHEYWLPALSRGDFDLILQHRGVSLDAALVDRFYTAMQENALYLDLVARELAQADAIEPEQIIARVADNPANLFSLSIERLQRHERQWESVLRPIFGLLLATRAPISQRALRALIGVDDLRTRQGLQRLGGLIQRDGEGRYGLFHLKLGDYLRQDVFASDEEESYHQQLVDWCEGGKGGIGAIWTDMPNDALEQERRVYARQHYIAHLAAARSYAQLWDVIDSGQYGQAKRRHDPSMRSYALDLDIARGAVITATGGDLDAQIKALPRLWRYSLLRCSLTSHADNYPEELFLALVALGRVEEAINLAELLSDPAKKANTLRAIGSALLERGSKEGLNVLKWARVVADSISDAEERATALRILAEAFVQAQIIEANTTFTKARKAAKAISNTRQQLKAIMALDQALSKLTQALIQAQQWEQAIATATAFDYPEERAKALLKLALALTEADHPQATATFAAARNATIDILYDNERSEALSALGLALSQAQHPDAAATFVAARHAADASGMSERAVSLSALGLALSQAQHPDAAATFIAARHAADATRDANKHFKALSALALALAQAEHLDAATTFCAARNAANAIFCLVDPIRNADTRVKALRTLALIPAQIQDWDGVRMIIEAIRDAEEQARHIKATCRPVVIVSSPVAIENDTNDLHTLINALTRAQQWDEAITVANTIRNTSERAKSLSALALTLTQAQHPDAETTFTAARKIAVAISDARARIDALSGLAYQLAKAQHPEAMNTITDARQVVAMISDAKDYTDCKTKLAFALGQANHPDAETAFILARTYAEAIGTAQQCANAPSTLAKGYAKPLRWKEARATADAISDASTRAQALRELALALAQHQHPEAAATFTAACAAAHAIGDAFTRAQALRKLALALAQHQHPEAVATFTAARAAAHALSTSTLSYNPKDVSPRISALCDLAQAFTLAQYWEDARITADAISDASTRAQVLRELALALAQHQHPNAAATFIVACAAAQTISDAEDRAIALRTLAQALAQHQDYALFADIWHQTQTRNDLLSLFAVDAALFRAHPSLAQEFLDSFAWVDTQLRLV